MKFEPKLYHLSNGIPVILDPMDIETVAVKIAFDTGSRDETPNEYGITHFCEHMLCKGIPSLPNSKSMKDFIENKGGVYNASTSRSLLSIYGRIIAENTNDLLWLFSEMLKNALFDEDKIEIERSVILDELRRAQGNNSRKFNNLIDTNLFGFSAFQTLGTEQNIKSFSRNQLLSWLRNRTSAKNCVICVSGHIGDTSVLLERIEKLFNFLPTHDVERHKDLTYTACDKFQHEPSLKNVWLGVLFPYIRPDTYENVRKDLAEQKFRKYLAQEMNEVVRQQNGLVYGIGITSYGSEFDGVRCIDTETAPENLARAVALMAQTAYRIYNKDTITQNTIERFVNRGKLADADFLESATRRCDVLINYFIDFGKLYDFQAMAEMNKSITAEEAIKYSQGFFDGPMSIMSFGAEHNLDLKQIWIDNFK
ncbi:MAG: insulinase family protein [Alphaproteobacteria bacterium]|nr:insulinase family protein [Alphaproteobacteria bacterium]